MRTMAAKQEHIMQELTKLAKGNLSIVETAIRTPTQKDGSTTMREIVKFIITETSKKEAESINDENIIK